MSDIIKLITELPAEKRAALAALLLRGQENAPRQVVREPVAIVGIGCRFPGDVNNAEAYWELLREGRDAITEVPNDRWDIDAFYDPDPDAPGKMRTRWGGFVRDPDKFDATFFGISPREAVSMDPQQRFLLEVTWEALEDAGQAVDRLAGSKTGIFVGINVNDYGQSKVAGLLNMYTATGNALALAANRLSYILNFHGPSMSLDTACSSSLVATHLACQSLAAGESTLAVAAGVNLILSPENTIRLNKFLSPEGHCKTFDASADGYVRGEGACAVVLKLLSKAQADGDPIYAVIRGSAVNHDGRSGGLTVPSGRAQQLLIQDALASASVKPSEVSYVEAHGTGTPLGDPIEANALGAVMTKGRPAGSTCAIGSVKSNFGHLEAVAGLAGLVKVALSLQHRALPPSLHFTSPNPEILFHELPLRVQKSLEPWPEATGPRIAGVSSFGFGGANAHIILEEAPATSLKPEQSASNGKALAAIAEGEPGEGVASSGVYLLPLSARSPEALRQLASRYLDYVGVDDSTLPELRDLCYTAGARRSHHQHRLCVAASSYEQLRQRLASYLEGRPAAGLFAGKAPESRPPVAFVFAGQGAQWPGMGRELADAEPVFRQKLEECVAALRPHLDWEPLDLLLAEPHDEASSAEAERLRLTSVAQPLMFAMQVSLAALWRSWGVEPEAVVGHSMGEVAAAHVSGALSLEEAARVICLRGRVMEESRGQGAMTAVELSAAETEAAISEAGATGVEVAAVNAPRSCVVAGEVEGLGALERWCEARGVRAKRLGVDYAFHTQGMKSCGQALEAELGEVRAGECSARMYSTVTGAEVNGGELDAGYWARNVSGRVEFMRAVGAMAAEGVTRYVELGAERVLWRAVAESAASADGLGGGGRGVLVTGALRRK
ncbi:MAG TPA: type I polyketide synthase, partial [Pyrinomonadaceae bacterium]